MKQRKKYFLVAVAAVLLAGIAYIQDEQAAGEQLSDGLPRGSPGDGDTELVLELDVEELGQKENYTIEVKERVYSREERKALFEAAIKELEEGFTDEEPQHITKAVHLPQTLQNGVVEVEWSFEDSEVICSDGSIDQKLTAPEGTMVTVCALLSYREDVYEYRFPVCVYPQELVGMDRVKKELADYFGQQDTQKKKLSLPDKIGGYTLSWKRRAEHTWVYMLALGAAALLLVRFSASEKELRAQQQRREELKRQYPVMVSEFALLLSAGMTIRQVWEHLVRQYGRQQEQKKGTKQLIYEEMLTSYRQMQDGMSEAAAYEQFGKRCKTPECRRFSMLLVQQLRKGSGGLVIKLHEEADRSFEERKNAARKRGEEISTKLLVPMFMMLGVVLVILLVPACMTMQIS